MSWREVGQVAVETLDEITKSVHMDLARSEGTIRSLVACPIIVTVPIANRRRQLVQDPGNAIELGDLPAISGPPMEIYSVEEPRNRKRRI